MEQLPILRSQLLSRFPDLVCAISTRRGGVSTPPFDLNLSFNVGDRPEDVQKNRERFFTACGVCESDVAIPRQVHGDSVLSTMKPGTFQECDGLITGVRGVFLSVTIADCVPILIYDDNRKTVAAVHAGWKGSSMKIVETAVHKMVQELGSNPANLFCFIGPSAGVCCYEVGNEVAAQFKPHFVDERDGRFFVDLKAANRDQLLTCGVPHDQIELSPYCTISKSELLHSYRREREQSGRMIALIGLSNVAPN